MSSVSNQNSPFELTPVFPTSASVTESANLKTRCVRWCKKEPAWKLMGIALGALSITGYAFLIGNTDDPFAVCILSGMSTVSLAVSCKIFYRIHQNIDPEPCDIRCLT